jgi:hypothetical protein
MRVRRSSARGALTLGAFAATALVWSGCEAKKQTEYVAGVSTQVQVPRDLKAIRVDVSVGGVVQFCRGYRVYDGKVQLPRSLGEFPSQGTPGPDPITVTVSGFTEEFSETTGNSVFDNCTSVAPKVGDPGQGTRILRRSRQPYVTDSVLFLPMPLKYSCFDVTGCEDETKTCKAGRCVDARIDETKLPKYTDELIDGTGAACFDAASCFAAAAPAVVVDANDCTYAVPNSPPSSPPQLAGVGPNPFPKSGDGVNVEITYDGGLNREILDKDEAEGFFVPDPVGKPQQFRLTAGLCDMVKGYSSGVGAGAPAADTPTPHRITAVRVSGTCQAKSQFQPLCAAAQLVSMGVDPAGISANASVPNGCIASEMRPPKAALLVLADDTHSSKLFYDAAVQSTVGLSLADPAFQKTELGLGFFPGPGTCATPGSFTNAVPPKLARQAKGDVVAQFAALGANDGALLKPAGTPVDLDGALRDAYAFLNTSAFTSYYRRAVFVIGNHDFDKATCGQTPQQRATAAVAQTNRVQTYVLILARDFDAPAPADGDPVVIPAGAQELAEAGGTGRVYDARKSKGIAQDSFQAVVNDLATCVYDVIPPQTRPDAQSTLSYTDPIDHAAATKTLAFNAACTTENVSGEGFGLDATNPNRAYLCQDSCTKYRDILRTASLYAAQNGQSPIAVPVFAHKQGCPVPAGGGAGSGG